MFLSVSMRVQQAAACEGGVRTVKYEKTQPKSYGSSVAERELEPGMGYARTGLIRQHDAMIKNPKTWFYIPPLPFTGCVILGSLSNFLYVSISS